MKRFLSIGMALCLGMVFLASCKPSDRVSAASEDDYQPGPAPSTEGYARKDAADTDAATRASAPAARDLKGELMRIDMKRKTMVLRVENGMEQTVKWTDNTTVTGVPARRPSKVPATAVNMKLLSGRRGSEMVVEWTAENDQKVATVIHVTDLVRVPRKGR